MSWSEPGFGFFGKGFWGRRVLWDNVPVQQRTLDTYGHLEQLLGIYGDELEAFLAAIAQLPAQRDPFAVRAAAGQGEWFYVTSTLRWTDPVWGEVLRLIGEPDYALMPSEGHAMVTFASAGYTPCVLGDLGLPVAGVTSGSAGTLLSYNNTTRTWWIKMDDDADIFDLVEIVAVTGGTGRGQTAAAAPTLSPWYPYLPISSTARWWRSVIPGVDDATGTEAPAEYEVALVRTRNYDHPGFPAGGGSLGNEVWVRGGDLVLNLQHPANWIVTGDAVVDTAAYGPGVSIGLGDGTPAPTVALPGPQQRLRANVTDPIGPPWLTSGARLILDLQLQTLAWLRLYDAPDAAPAVETGGLYREDPLVPGQLDLATRLGTVDYLTGTICLDLSPLSLYSLFDGPITAYWEARGCYLHFLPPRVIDYLARDYGFDNDRNDPEDRQRVAIVHLAQYFGCKGAQEAYRIRGDISLFDVFVRALWRICTAEIAGELPADHVFEYGGTFYTDLEPRSIRFDDIRGDEQYYDIFNHENPGPPEWLSLVDRALMFPDSDFADGMSPGMAYALDVTQGYQCPVSETNPAWRTPATVLSSTPLTTAEATAYSIPAGHRVVVRMQRRQAEAFNFHRGYFGITEYDQSALVRPAIDDAVFWIDYEEVAWTLAIPGATADEDIGDWTIIIGVGFDDAGLPLPGPTVGSDVAVRYWPEIDRGDCCFCRSYKVRVEIAPKAEAYAYYETEAAMREAVDRLKGKLLDKLVPIHVRVAEWVVTTEFTVFMGGVRAGAADTRYFDADEFTDLGPSGKVELGIEQRGDLSAPPKRQTMELWDADGNLLLSTGAVFTGASDPDTWYPVAGYDPATPADVTGSVGGEVVHGVATAHATVAYGDVRWTFRVTRGTLG